MDATLFLQLDFVPLLAAVLACATCGLLGNLLLLTRQSLLGDAISHSVLPGIVLGFVVSGTRAPLPMVIGAVGAAILAVLLIEGLKRAARLEPGAAMGVVFSGFFAVGLVLIETTGARSVDLDVDCVLYGQLEALIWPAAEGWGSLTDPVALAELPPELATLAVVAAASAAFVLVFWKELRLAAFDPDFAASIGFAPRLLSLGSMLLIASACVASFWAVGSILVIAALIAPAAAARCLTDRYGTQLGLSVALGAGAAAFGYGGAAWLPETLGLPGGLNAAGMMAVAAGVLLAVAVGVARVRRGVAALRPA